MDLFFLGMAVAFLISTVTCTTPEKAADNLRAWRALLFGKRP